MVLKPRHRDTEFTEDALRTTVGSYLPAGLTIAATTAAVSTATAAVSTAAVAATTTTAAAKTTTAAAATIFAGLGFVHVQRTTINFLTIELSDSGLALFLARHFDKTETA
jgi:hypothetical protein